MGVVAHTVGVDALDVCHEGLQLSVEAVLQAGLEQGQVHRARHNAVIVRKMFTINLKFERAELVPAVFKQALYAFQHCIGHIIVQRRLLCRRVCFAHSAIGM